MSYRSEIAIRLELPKGMKSEDILEKIEEYTDMKAEKLFDKVLVEKISENLNLEIILLYHSYIEWRTDFYEIKAFENFLSWYNEIIDNNERLLDTDKFYVEDNLNFHFCGAYHFIRIGENIDDIEERCYGNLWDYIEIERKINLNI